MAVVPCALSLSERQADNVTPDGVERDSKEEQPFFGLPLPVERHQRLLDIKAIKQLRTQSNTAAKDKTLVNIQASACLGHIAEA